MPKDDDEVVAALVGTAVLALGGYTIYRILKSLTKEDAPANARSSRESISDYTPAPRAADNDDDYEDPARYTIHCFACGISYQAASESESCSNCGNRVGRVEFRKY